MGFPELIRSIGEDEARERTAGLFGHFGEEFFMVWQQRARRIPVLKAVNDETVSVLQPKLDAELSSQDEQQICALLQGLGLFSIGVATNLEAYPEVLSAALQTDASRAREVTSATLNRNGQATSQFFRTELVEADKIPLLRGVTAGLDDRAGHPAIFLRSHLGFDLGVNLVKVAFAGSMACEELAGDMASS